MDQTETIRQPDRTMTAEEIERYEQRNAAIHEAGHAVLWHVLGEQLHWVAIFPNPNPSPDNKTWVGQTSGRIFTEKNNVLIGLAGEIAETLEDNPDLTGWEMEEQLEYLSLPSESDLKLIDGYSSQDVDRVISLVRENWEAIKTLKSMLLESNRVEWDTVAALTERREA